MIFSTISEFRRTFLADIREGNSSLKAVQKLLIKTVGERDYHLFLQLPMFKASRDLLVSGYANYIDAYAAFLQSGHIPPCLEDDMYRLLQHSQSNEDDHDDNSEVCIPFVICSFLHVIPILVSCYGSLSYYRNRRVARPTLDHYDQRRSVCLSVSRMHTCSLAGTPRMGSTGPWLPTCTPPSWRLHPSSPSRDKQLDSICSPPQPILGGSHRPAADRPPNCSRHSQRSSTSSLMRLQHGSIPGQWSAHRHHQGCPHWRQCCQGPS